MQSTNTTRCLGCGKEIQNVLDFLAAVFPASVSNEEKLSCFPGTYCLPLKKDTSGQVDGRAPRRTREVLELQSVSLSATTTLCSPDRYQRETQWNKLSARLTKKLSSLRKEIVTITDHFFPDDGSSSFQLGLLGKVLGLEQCFSREQSNKRQGQHWRSSHLFRANPSIPLQLVHTHPHPSPHTHRVHPHPSNGGRGEIYRDSGCGDGRR